MTLILLCYISDVNSKWSNKISREMGNPKAHLIRAHINYLKNKSVIPKAVTMVLRQKNTLWVSIRHISESQTDCNTYKFIWKATRTQSYLKPTEVLLAMKQKELGMASVTGAFTPTVGLKKWPWMSDEDDSYRLHYRESLGEMSAVLSIVQKGKMRHREVKQHVCLRSPWSKGQSWTSSQVVHLQKPCFGFRWVPHCFLPKACWNEQIFKRSVPPSEKKANKLLNHCIYLFTCTLWSVN